MSGPLDDCSDETMCLLRGTIQGYPNIAMNM
jgi:hypothetical protein